MKKTLAIVLTLALVICMMPANAFAAADDPVASEQIDVSNVTVALDKTSAEYNGSVQIAPSVKLSGQNADKLVVGTHYTAKWSESVMKDAKTYTLTFAWDTTTTTGGAAIQPLTFVITPCDLSKVNISIPEQEDDTNQNLQDKIKPLIIFKNAANAQLNLNQDITVTVRDNTANSKIAVVSKRTENVTGTSSEVVFSVKPGISNYQLAPASIVPKTYTGQPITQPTAYLVDASGKRVDSRVTYQLKYSNNTDAGSAIVWAEGTGNYVGKTKSVQFQIAQADAATAYRNGQLIVSDIPNQLVNARPSVTVTERGKTQPINPATYSVSYQNNNTAGTAKAIISFSNKGNYSGSIEKTFTIISGNNVIRQGEASIVGAGIGNVKSTYYNGTTQSVSVNVAKNGATYRVEYRNDKGVVVSPKDAGDYSVYVIGTGNYAGEVYAGTLRIMPIPLDWTEIVLGSATVYDTSSRTYVPKVTLRTKSGYTYGYTGNVIIPETDYNVSYRWVNSTSAYLRPTAVVTKAAKAVNLTNATNQNITEITKEFNTATKNLAYCTASFTDGRSSSAYTGSAVTPKVTVRDGYTTLDPSTYTVTYKNASGKVVSSMRDAGTYTVVIKGNGAYYGELTLTYTITGTDIGNYTITLKESSVTADGRTKTPVITSVSYGYYSKLSSSDYTVSYQDSTGKEVKSYQMSTPGTYKVVVTGKNGYTGSCYATFTIVGLSQSITGVDGSYKVYPTSETFRLYPKATEGRFTYTSSDPSVASVDAFGNVTPYKAGRAKITISTTGNVRYNPVTTSTVIKVYPNKAAMTRKPWTAGKGKIKVRWNKQDNVTRYEVRYSKNKSFKKGTYKTKKVNAAVNAYTTQSTTLSGLNSGYTYYVKVRAVKEVYNDYGKKLTYYGKWSGWRSVRVK